jgi:hypothetical protein
MGEAHIDDVYKITSTKVEDLDEVILVVQVCIRKFGVRDILLDGGSGVNMISESLRKKIGLKKPKLAPFVVRMADQKKV